MDISKFCNLAARELERLMEGDGGFAYTEGSEVRADATAWGLLALRLLQSDAASIERTAQKLESWQDSSGSLVLPLDRYPAVWPSSLALLAWSGMPGMVPASEKAAQFLLHDNAVVRSNRPPKGSEINDPDFSGWPWNNGTYSWVIPTSVALLALKSSGHEKEERCARAIEMLLERQLPHGGWNYGNTIIFNTELLPLPDTTGLALCALAGHVGLDKVQRSLDYLQSVLAGISSPLAMAWGILALKAWGIGVTDCEARAQRAFEKARSYGALNCESLGMLAACVQVAQNLPLTLRAAGEAGLK